MQSYNLNIGLNQTRPFNTQGDLFVYESGTATPNTGDTRILVKPDTGAEMQLKPGQGFRLKPGEDATHWEVRALDPAVVINGVVVIGGGEFFDANTLNKFTLDASLANNVTVTNTTASRVPVTLDITQQLTIGNTTANRVPVTLDTSQLLQIAGQTVQYTNSFIDATTAANTAIQVFSAAQNPNGAYIEFAEIAMSASVPAYYNIVTMLVKATAPTGPTDGDAVMLGVCQGGTAGGSSQAQNLNQILGQRIKVPANKGLYINQQIGTSAGDRCIKTVLFTLL